MKKKIVMLFIFALQSAILFAQEKFVIRGTVTDANAGIVMPNTTITILNSRDSILVSYSRADTNGEFSLEIPVEGEFILLVGYPGYADYVQVFKLNSKNRIFDAGNIKLISKAILLQEVIVKGKVSEMKIIGDTTEFNAAAFELQANAKVDDLLKQIPGMQINQDGQISVRGQVVNKVLLDGEEFFGDDPTLITKNIRADMVDKVQLYDGKTDRAKRTGADDGEKVKTLNIKLKDDKKNGYFGKIDAGAGNNDFLEGQGMFNYFKTTSKLSVFRNFANTGKTGLTIRDNSRYGYGSDSRSYNGLVSIAQLGNDDLESNTGKYNGEGSPLTRSGGGHYDVNWGEGKNSLNANYKIGSITVDGTRNTLTQNSLPEGLIRSDTNLGFRQLTERQKLDFTYKSMPTPNSELLIVVDGMLKENDDNKDYRSSSFKDGVLILNDSKRRLDNKGNQSLFNASAMLTKRLKREGRYLTFGIWQTANNSKITGFLESENTFYNSTGSVDSIQNIDQLKLANSKNLYFGADISYNEPLSKSFSLLLNYSFVLNNSSSKRETFDRSSTGYDNVNNAFSNNFELRQNSHQTGLLFGYFKDKTLFNFGTNMSVVGFDQVDRFDNTTLRRTFFNWMPQVTYRYNPTHQKSLRFKITGQTIQPNLYQLQPVLINDDPLNISVGNALLKPAFSTNVNLSYSSYKVLSDQTIYLNTSYFVTNNSIVNTIRTDPAGKNVYQFTNLNNKSPSTVSFNGIYQQKLKKNDLRVGLDLNMTLNSYYNKVNDVLNEAKLGRYSTRFSVSQVKANKRDVYLNIGPEYITTRNSLQRQITNNGWGINSSLAFNFYLPGKMMIGSDVAYSFNDKTDIFHNTFNRFIWNTTLSRKFLKSENLTMLVYGNDLLNNNMGFSRTAFNNMISQDSYNTIKRYIMIKAIYDFNKMNNSTTK